MNSNFDLAKQQKSVRDFHALHHSDTMLVLPSAWDCVSAKIYEQSGFSAIATTSSGISWSNGYQDGECIPPDEMIRTIERITRSVDIPVTADIEGGYIHNSYKKLSQFFSDVIDAGAVGINIEDRCSGGVQCDMEYQMDVIALAKEVGEQKGINLFVNARTDSMAFVFGDLRTKVEVSIRRAHAFAEAGADGIFIPFVNNMEVVSQLKKEIQLPLNILMEKSLSISELRKLKVNRISVGSKPILATLSLLKTISDELRNGDNWSSILDNASTSYKEVNDWFPECESDGFLFE